MKRLIGLLISVVMLLLITACGNKNETVDTQTNITSTTSSTVESSKTDSSSTISSIVESPETNNSSTTSSRVENLETNENTTSSTNNTTESNNTQNTSSTNDVQETVHKHSYSKNVTSPTCTKQGYTTYTCSCGKSYTEDYTEPTHSYSNHICSKCGVVEPSYSYEYLADWIKKTDNTSVTLKDYDGRYSYRLSYDPSQDSLFLKQEFTESEHNVAANFSYDSSGYVKVYLNEKNQKFDYYYYWYAIYRKFNPYTYNKMDLGIEGVIDGNEYTGSSLDYTRITGSEKQAAYDNLKEARRMINNLLNLLGDYLEKNIPGITLEGLGFTCY